MPLAPTNGPAAVARALKYIGQSYPVGYCQKFTNEIFQTGAVGDWDGDKSADAEDGWKKAVADGKVVHATDIKNLDDIPAAVMLYWTGGSHDHGHAAVGIGRGHMVSTDLPTQGSVGNVPISMAHDRWGLTFAGYVTIEGNGYDLGSYAIGTNKTSAPKKKGALYTVTAKSGLYARESPDGKNVMRDGHKLVRPHGFTIRVVGTQKAGGRTWAHGSGGLWYAASYLRKK